MLSCLKRLPHYLSNSSLGVLWLDAKKNIFPLKYICLACICLFVISGTVFVLYYSYFIEMIIFIFGYFCNVFFRKIFLYSCTNIFYDHRYLPVLERCRNWNSDLALTLLLKGPIFGGIIFGMNLVLVGRKAYIQERMFGISQYPPNIGIVPFFLEIRSFFKNQALAILYSDNWAKMPKTYLILLISINEKLKIHLKNWCWSFIFKKDGTSYSFN